MTAVIVIRPATRADVRDIAAIYAHAVEYGTASFEIEPPSETEMTTRMKMLQDGGFPYLVADAGGVVAGFAYAGPYRPRFAYRYTVEDSVYVNARVHRRGIGRMLLAELIVQAQQRGYRQMIAVIGDSAQTASIALHRSQGFEMTGTLRNVGLKNGRWLDSVLMQRALGEGASTLPTPAKS
jgi:L-amino acid N-acyltransferase YncA